MKRISDGAAADPETSRRIEERADFRAVALPFTGCDLFFQPLDGILTA
jgi:hypothetical protein